MILLSFALADKINIFKADKEKSQEETLKALKENERMIREQNVDLELKVNVRTTELNRGFSWRCCRAACRPASTAAVPGTARSAARWSPGRPSPPAGTGRCCRHCAQPPGTTPRYRRSVGTASSSRR